MEPIGRINVLQFGVFIDQGRPIDPGSVREFLDPQILGVADTQIFLNPDRSTGNSIDLTISTLPHWQVHPVGRDLELTGKFNFGGKPGSTVVQLGKADDPTLVLEFLGHPNRDAIQPLLEAQDSRYDPHAKASFTSFLNGKIQDLIMASPVIRIPFENDFSRVMFILNSERQAQEAKPFVFLSAAVLTDKDHLLRIYKTEGGIHAARSSYSQKSLKRAAEITIFLRDFASRLGEIGLTSISPWLVRDLADYISNRNSGYNSPPYEEEAEKKYYQSSLGFDWTGIRSSLKQSDIKEELSRLQNCLSIN
jgi:hypothetical protein